MVKHQTPEDSYLGSMLTPRNPWIRWGGGVAFIKDLRQLEFGSVYVGSRRLNQTYSQKQKST